MSITGFVGDAAVPRVRVDDGLSLLQETYARCESGLYRYAAVRCGDQHLAEDFLQQLWLRASTAVNRPPVHELEFWLRGILANLIRSHWRKVKRRPRHVPLADPTLANQLAERIDREPLPEDMLGRSEVRDQLLLAITALSSQDQELIIGTYFEHRSQSDLARALGISVRAVEGRLYRARTALKKSLAHLA